MIFFFKCINMPRMVFKIFEYVFLLKFKHTLTIVFSDNIFFTANNLNLK
jgi:hypothetical protein